MAANRKASFELNSILLSRSLFYSSHHSPGLSLCVKGILDTSNSHHINDLPLTMVQNLLGMYLNRNYC